MTIVRMRRALPNRTWGLGPSLFTDFDRFFDAGAPVPASDGAAADLYETDEALVLEMAVPGLSGEDLDISVEGRQLSIRASLPEVEDENRRYWLKGMVRGEINRSVKLPASVDVDAIDARVENGLLHLSMPKAAEAKVKKIAISNSNN